MLSPRLRQNESYRDENRSLGRGGVSSGGAASTSPALAPNLRLQQMDCFSTARGTVHIQAQFKRRYYSQNSSPRQVQQRFSIGLSKLAVMTWSCTTKMLRWRTGNCETRASRWLGNRNEDVEVEDAYNDSKTTWTTFLDHHRKTSR